MNIDMREANKALHRTKCHVETIQEIRHKPQGNPSDHDQQHSPKTIRPHTKNHSHN